MLGGEILDNCSDGRFPPPPPLLSGLYLHDCPTRNTLKTQSCTSRFYLICTGRGGEEDTLEAGVR